MPPAPARSEVSLESVTSIRGAHRALTGVTLRMSEARIGVIGDNGAGKSSLFRLICGLDKPSAGVVRVTARPDRLARAGMMFQNPDDMIVCPIVVDEVALGLSRRNMPRERALSQARDLLLANGVLDWAERSVSSLSHGQRQYVCWLSLCLAGCSVLLLDEPFASLDLPTARRLRQEIDNASSRAQVIVSTHALEQVTDFERVIWLENGHVRADGPGSVVCKQYLDDVSRRSHRPDVAASLC